MALGENRVFAASSGHPALPNFVFRNKRAALDERTSSSVFAQIQNQMRCGSPMKNDKIIGSAPLSLQHLVIQPKTRIICLPDTEPVAEFTDTLTSVKDSRRVSLVHHSERPECPCWWQRLCLFNLANFLTPGLFDGSAESEEEESDTLSLSVATGFSKDSAVNDAHPLPWMVPVQQPPRLHIIRELQWPWVHSIVKRHELYWASRRRQHLLRGRTVGEIGTLTTVSSRDYAAVHNSLYSILATHEEVERIFIERCRHQELAGISIAEAYNFKLARLVDLDSPVPDPLITVAVQELDERDDVTEEYEESVHWHLLIHVTLPLKLALSRRAKLIAASRSLHAIGLVERKTKLPFSVTATVVDPSSTN
jgi:hypothetical protein